MLIVEYLLILALCSAGRSVGVHTISSRNSATGVQGLLTLTKDYADLKGQEIRLFNVTHNAVLSYLYINKPN
jgi:hypothetical protein